MATQPAIIVLSLEAILICAIPPLLPQPPDFFDHNPATRITPLFTIPFPDGTVLPSEFMRWKTFSSWYFGTTSLYFDMFCRNAKLYRFQIMLKPDLSTTSLRVINTPELCPRDFHFLFFQDYKFCEDTLVSCWFYDDHDHPGQYQCGVYTGLKFTRFAVISHGGPVAKRLSPNLGHEYHLVPCPASGRFVLMDIGCHSVVVFDLF